MGKGHKPTTSQKQPRLVSSCCKAGFTKLIAENHGTKNNGDYKLVRKILQTCANCHAECGIELYVETKQK